MDWTTVYAKTAKGIMELSGKSRRLSRDLARLLQLVDGKTSVEQLLTVSGKSEMKLNQALDSLLAEGYVKVLMSGRQSQFAEDFGFPATIGVSEVNTQAFIDAQARAVGNAQAIAEKHAWNEELADLKRELDSEIQREADKIARVALETRAREEAEKALKAKQEAESRAKEEARVKLTEKLRHEAEKKAQAEADAVAKRETEERAAAEKAEQLRLAAESRARAEADLKEKQAAREQEAARIKAENAARAELEAEERVRMAEAARKIEAEAKARAEQERKVREEAIARAEAEQQAFEAAQEKEIEQKRAEERLRKRLEARAKEEAEIKARAEAAERARLEAIERAKAEEVARILAEAEAKRRAEEEAIAQAEAQKKAEEQAKAEAEAKAVAEAKAKAEAEAQAEAEAKARAEAEAQAEIEAAAKAEAERIAQEAAAEQARLDVERNAREEAELQARRAAEAQAREEAEKIAQAEAEEQARQEAEELARLEEAARIKAEAEAKIREAEEVVARAKAEAEETARLEAEQQAREFAEAQARAKAQEKAEAEAEAEERRQAEARAIALAEIKARDDERQARQPTFKPARKPHNWGKPVLISLAALLALFIGLLHVITLNIYIPDVEKLASARLHVPVTIRTLRGSLWPSPHLKLEGVALGKLRDVKMDTVLVTPDVFSLFSNANVIKRIEADGILLDQDALPGMQNWLADSGPNSLQVNRIELNRVNLALKDIQLPAFDAAFDLAENGAIEHVTMKSSDNKLQADIAHQGESWQIDFAGRNWQLPLGPELVFDEVHGKALLSGQTMQFSELEGKLYGGVLKGAMKLSWEPQWNLSGTFNVNHLDLKEATPAISKDVYMEGALQASATYSLQSASPAKLFETPRLQATFNIDNGMLGSVDLVRAIQSTTTTEISGGQTRFDKFSGVMLLASNHYQLNQMVMSAGLLHASGNAQVTSERFVNGHVSAELGTKGAMNRAKMVVSGKLGEPVLRKGN